MSAIPPIVDRKENPPKASVWATKTQVAPKSQEAAEKLPAPATEGFQIFNRSLKFLSLFGVIIGTDIRFNWKRDLRYTFTKWLTAYAWSQYIYTQIMYVYQHEIIRIWEVFAIYGIGMSAVLKIRCFEKYFKNIAALFEATRKICQQNTGRRGDRLKRRLLANFNFYKFVAFMAVVIITIFLFYPVKSFFMDGLLVPFLPFEFMFIDQSTLFGYILASIINIMVTMGVYVLLGSEYMGLTFVYLISDYSTRVDILEIDVNELDELWADTSTSTLADRHMYIRNMCRKYIDMRNYVTEVKEIFDEKMFLYFAFAYLSQILCMYQIRVNNWIPGYGTALGLFLEMIFYCMMGTKVTVENDRIYNIFTQSKWYTYDLRSQKMMLLLINLAINCDELWIGPVKPLSVYTATEIIKSIYSYYTVMLEVM